MLTAFALLGVASLLMLLWLLVTGRRRKHAREHLFIPSGQLDPSQRTGSFACAQFDKHSQDRL